MLQITFCKYKSAFSEMKKLLWKVFFPKTGKKNVHTRSQVLDQSEHMKWNINFRFLGIANINIYSIKYHLAIFNQVVVVNVKMAKKKVDFFLAALLPLVLRVSKKNTVKIELIYLNILQISNRPKCFIFHVYKYCAFSIFLYIFFINALWNFSKQD